MQTVRHIAVLGSTGSIGTSALDVIERHPDRFRVSALTAHRNIALLREQIVRIRPSVVVVDREDDAAALRAVLDGHTDVLSGEEGLLEVVSRPEVSLVLNSLVGFAGLTPTVRAIEAGKDVALANKETLVVGGSLIMNMVRDRGVKLLPIDSEHSAVLQCLQGEDISTVDRLVLTASGGPFLATPAADLARVTREEALNHPTWRMGKKISIDSATLMNKGLEVIEAHWLFGLPAEKIDVVIHPQSIIHSLVEFADGSMKAQLGLPDMKLPIQYALAYPDRPRAPHGRLDLASLRQMTFFDPDSDRFPCLPLAYRALEMGGTAPAVLNAANEVAVQLFLDGAIGFTDIAEFIGQALERHTPIRSYTLDDLIAVDHRTRDQVRQYHSSLA